MNLRAWAARMAERIDSSLLATDDERTEALSLVNQLADQKSRQHTFEGLMRLEQLAEEVMSRESGRAYLSPGDREELQEGLAVLEDRLVGEINARKRAQRRDLLFFLTMLGVLILFTVSGAAYLLLSQAATTVEMLGQVISLAVGISAILIVARLFQNSREALERLDEKVVAVRFLRMALHPSWTGDMGGRLIAPALAMFAQHFAPSSATLGVDDSRSLLEPFIFGRRYRPSPATTPGPAPARGAGGPGAGARANPPG